MDDREYVLFASSAAGLRMTSSGKGLWVRLEDGMTVCVPCSVISARSEVQEPGQLGDLVVAEWWANLPRVSVPESNRTDPDHRLVLIDDITKQEIVLHKRVCVWCGLKNAWDAGRCFHCARDPKTGEL